jgi:flagellar biosynthesis/type III secretory pathway M-ring protein FliF/YscJ
VSETKKEKFSIFDWIATVIGVIVVGFIVFILIWPFIDPTPDRSATLQENLHSITKPGNTPDKSDGRSETGSRRPVDP